MNFKRILAAVLCAAAVTNTAFAFTPYLPEHMATEEAEGTQSTDGAQQEAGADTQQSPSSSIITQVNTRDYQFRLFMETLDLYTKEHLYEFTKEDVIYKFFQDFLTDNPMYFKYFMNYMLGTMDNYSSYHEASSDFLEPQSSSLGFGFMIKDSDDGVYIENVIEGTNAKDAGFMPGDKFVSIAGVNVEGQTFNVVSALLADPATFINALKPKEEPKPQAQQAADANSAAEGTQNLKGNETDVQTAPEPLKLEIVVNRNGENKAFTISKGDMPISQLETLVDDNNGKPTAYIKVSSFLGDNTDKDFVELLLKYERDGIKNLTIDLRDNHGGSLDYALFMAEAFLEKDELICYYKDKKLQEPKGVYSTTDKVSFDSINILINKNSASAAELFTSILSDKGIAKVIGEKSFGKSLGQSVYYLANGDYITITSYQMLNENFESYDGKGLKPDIAIEEVEMCYELATLGAFNHTNAKQIEMGVYSDAAKALEDRMVVMGLLREKYNDGIIDDVSKTALFAMKAVHNIDIDDTLIPDRLVSEITRIINTYKNYSYLDNTQYEVAMICHHSFSQGKRLAAEKERLRKEQKALLDEREAKINAELDKLEQEANAKDEKQQAQNESVTQEPAA